jgi:hypothetical protein
MLANVVKFNITITSFHRLNHCQINITFMIRIYDQEQYEKYDMRLQTQQVSSFTVTTTPWNQRVWRIEILNYGVHSKMIKLAPFPSRGAYSQCLNWLNLEHMIRFFNLNEYRNLHIAYNTNKSCKSPRKRSKYAKQLKNHDLTLIYVDDELSLIRHLINTY